MGRVKGSQGGGARPAQVAHPSQLRRERKASLFQLPTGFCDDLVTNESLKVYLEAGITRIAHGNERDKGTPNLEGPGARFCKASTGNKTTLPINLYNE